MPYNWVAVLGTYEFREQEILYIGGERVYGTGLGPAIGNAIANQVFSGGEISARIRFHDAVDSDTGCDVILYYEPATKYFVSAGVGGMAASEFAIRYFDNKGWNLVGLAGERVNLKPDKEYDVQVTLAGSVVSLWINGVEVIRGILPFTLPGGQVGVWNRGRKNATIRDYKVRTEKPTAFVAMQFSPPYNELFADVIKPICEDEFGIKALRSDETFGPGLIIADIMAQINSAKIVIADITPENSNVFYEVGYAHAYRKPTILIADKTRKLPFDVSGFRTLFYENTIAGKRLVEEGLRKHLRAILTQLQIPAGPAAAGPASR